MGGRCAKVHSCDRAPQREVIRRHGLQSDEQCHDSAGGESYATPVLPHVSNNVFQLACECLGVSWCRCREDRSLQGKREVRHWPLSKRHERKTCIKITCDSSSKRYNCNLRRNSASVKRPISSANIKKQVAASTGIFRSIPQEAPNLAAFISMRMAADAGGSPSANENEKKTAPWAVRGHRATNPGSDSSKDVLPHLTEPTMPRQRGSTLWPENGTPAHFMHWDTASSGRNNSAVGVSTEEMPGKPDLATTTRGGDKERKRHGSF